MKLSAREKLLLYILGFLVVFLGAFRFLLQPSIQAYEEAKIQVEALEGQKQQLEMRLKQLENADENLEKEQKREKQSNYIYMGIDDVFVDRTLQAAAEKNSIKIKSSVIESSVYSEITAYSYNTDSKTSLSAQAAEKQEENSDAQQVLSYVCTISVSGKTVDIIDMISELNSMGKSIMITAVTSEDNRDIDNISGDEFTGNITATFYYTEN